MTEWVTKPLGGLVEIRVSNVDKKSSRNERPIRLCNYMDAYTRRYLRDGDEYMEATCTDREASTFALQRGDLIITKDSEDPNDIAIPALVDDDVTGLVCGYHLAILRPKPDAIDPTYLLAQLRSEPMKSYFAKRASGSTRYGLSLRTIAEAPVAVAPKSHQRLAGGIQRALDAQIQHTEALIAKQEQVRAGLMQDVFTRGVDARGCLRPPRGEAPHLYHQTPLGWLPKDWEVCGILRFCTDARQPVLTGPFGADLGRDDFVDDGIPLLRIGNVQDRRLRLDDLLYVDQRKALELAKYAVQDGDLLFARQGATTGRNCLATSEVEGALINYHIIRVSLDKAKCSPRFIEAVFNSWRVRRQIDQSKGRSTREGINTAQIVSLLLPGPTREEQYRIGSIIEAELGLAAKLARESKGLSQQRTGLMRDLLTPPAALATEAAA